MGRVLVVDDELDIVLMLRIALRQAGHDSLQAMTGEAALDLLKNETVDVMLLDIRLPGIDGWEVLQRVRADTDLQALKVIMMSAHSSPATMTHASDLGSDAYLTKPFTLDELTDVLTRTLNA